MFGKKRRLLSVTALVVSLCIMLNTGLQVYADTDELQASIKAKQAEIEQAEKEKKQIQGNITDAKKIVSGLESTKKDLEAYVTELDSNLTEVEAKIEELKELIADKEAEIRRRSGTRIYFNSCRTPVENKLTARRNCVCKGESVFRAVKRKPVITCGKSAFRIVQRFGRIEL